MNKKSKVKEKHNCLIVHLSGDQSSVKIFNANDKLIRHSQTKGAKRIEQIVEPGEYRIETDGKITKIESIKVELKKMDDPAMPEDL